MHEDIEVADSLFHEEIAPEANSDTVDCVGVVWQ